MSISIPRAITTSGRNIDLNCNNFVILKSTMCSIRCVLALVVLYVGLAQSWDIAATKGDLIEFYTHGIKTESIRFDSKNLTALVYAEVLNMMLFVDKQSGNDAVCGYDISSMEKKCFTERIWRNIHGLAFDPVTEKLFFSDTRERSINWISFKRGFVNNIYGNLLIRTGDGIPTDIAVDSCRGYVYWINTNLTPPKIEKARFDGSQREVIISIDSPNNLEPHSLIIDQQTQKMFWIEPKTGFKDRIYVADLNGNHKQQLNTNKTGDDLYHQPLSNTLTVSKTSLFWVDLCANCNIVMWELPKFIMTPEIISYVNFTLPTVGLTVGIAANYKIEEKLPEIQDCDPITSLVRNNYDRQNNYDRPFCVHGMQISGQSICKCTPGYIGERCDVSVCNNYCMQGNCCLNDAGLPKCRCNAGYSGNRCEVNECHGYCVNNGVCSLNENFDPLLYDPMCKSNSNGPTLMTQSFYMSRCRGPVTCRCNENYGGDRCETYYKPTPWKGHRG